MARVERLLPMTSDRIRRPAPAANAGSGWTLWCFDCDGTLLDSMPRFEEIYRHTVLRLGGRPVTDYAMHRRAGASERRLCRMAGLGDDAFPEYMVWRQRAFEACREPLRELPRAACLLASLRGAGAVIVVVSHRASLVSLTRDLQRAGLLADVSACFATKTSAIAAARGATARGGGGKADILRRLRSRGPTVMVGDSDADVAAAQTAGVASIAVASGCCSAERLRASGADPVYESLIELHRSMHERGGGLLCRAAPLLAR